MADLTTILPTSRAIRAKILHESQQDTFLPRYITMGEFLQRAVVVDGHERVDDDTRTLLLLEAADFSAFQNLHIERDFFTFTKNATYLFRFFEELSGELIDISALESADTYGDYEEHISILIELYERYEKLCMQKKVLDPIFLPKQYHLNKAYIRSLGAAELLVEGYLTDFEMQIIEGSAEEIDFSLLFTANRFNHKMQKKLERLGIEVRKDSVQSIDMNSLQVEESWSVESDTEMICETLGERLLQVAFIKQQVYAFIKSGMGPDKIVVVLPDEEFARHIRRFDSENNFNLAMGISLNESHIVKRLHAVMAYLDNPGVQNRARVDRLGSADLDVISPHYKADVQECDFSSIIHAFLEEEPEASVKEIVLEELFYFNRLLSVLAGSSLRSALYLFLNRVRSKRIDDVRGGKITVMGVLETRSVQYDGVIVVDFNENRVPRKSEKDLFLNSSTRLKAGLPGSKDRESLQKLYYHNLFLRAKRVSISYVGSSDAVPSRFLTQLGISSSKSYDDAQWADILFKKQSRPHYKSSEIVMAYDFTKRPLSATGLKTFLTCRRKFYHHYVEGLKKHEIVQDLPKEHEIGTALHDALRDVYTQQSRFDNKIELKKRVALALKEHNGRTLLDSYQHRLWLRRLEPFFDAEIERFESAEVLSCEESLTTVVRGIPLSGIIDRIDRRVDGLEVLDYKSGKYPIYTARTVEKAKDFQLEFYYLLAQQKGVILSCAYYDLKSGDVVDEVLLESKLELLYEHLQGLRESEVMDFSQTEDLSACRYCEFTHLCDRAL